MGKRSARVCSIKEKNLGQQYESSPVKQIIYSSKEDAYFFILDNHLYRKDIDQRKPKRIIKIGGWEIKSRIKYSEETKRLLISEKSRILIFNPRTSRIETRLQTTSRSIEEEQESEFKSYIEDFIIVESQSKPCKVLLLNRGCQLSLSEVSSRNIDEATRLDVPCFDYDIESESQTGRMSICAKNKIILLEF